MATSRSRNAAAKTAAPAKKSAPAKKTAVATNTAAPKKAAPSKAAAPAKKSAPAKNAAVPKKAAAPDRASAKKAAPAKKTATPQKSVAPKKAAPVAKNAAAPKKAAPKKAAPAKKAAAPKKAVAPAKAAAPARSAAAKKAAAPSRNATPARAANAGSKARSRGLNPQNDLQLILVDLLKDIYYAEKKLVRALGKMAKHATHEKLRAAFLTHQTQTEDQVAKLEQAFATMGLAPKAKKCAAMDGLLEESDEHMSEYHKGAGLDAALIVGAQKVEHYEIASYGSMRSIANSLGMSEAAAIFEAIREQESDTDELLTNIAEGLVNPQAEASHEDTDGEDEAGDNENRISRASSQSAKAGSASNGQADGNYDSEAGEDSSSAVTATASASANGSESGTYYENIEKIEEDIENDGTGRGAIASLTDGNDRGEASETGEAMGY